MKFIKKSLSVLLAAAVLLSCFGAVPAVFAAGEAGTKESPYVITTAQQLQAVNNAPDACYVLGGDIDLAGMDFTPLGNETSGSFTGEFDGCGHTVKNLNVFAGKFAGLFGCNEGLIKNLNVSVKKVYGTRYAGGIAAENAAAGTIADCTVTGGAVTAEYNTVFESYAGGICGYNAGVLTGSLTNGASVSGAYYDGGIAGYSFSPVSAENWRNDGDVTSENTNWRCAGGILGGVCSDCELKNCINNGSISNAYFGAGFIITTSGNNLNSSLVMDHCINNGVVSACTCAAGFICYYSGFYQVSLSQCTNNGDISGTVNAGGFAVDLPAGVFNNCRNTGNITCTGNGSRSNAGGFNAYYHSASHYVVNGEIFNRCCNSGTVSSDGNAYGISPVGTATQCVNTGKIHSTFYSAFGLIENGTVMDSCNYGPLMHNNWDYSNGISGYYTTITDSYSTGIFTDENETLCHSIYAMVGNEEKNNISADSLSAYLNDESVWKTDPDINSGYPTLVDSPSPIELNHCVKNLYVGESFDLKAYKNGTATDAVTWQTEENNVVRVGSDGRITALSGGFASVFAVDAEGNRTCCSVYVLLPNTYVHCDDISAPVLNKTYTAYISFGNEYDYLISAESNDENVFAVTGFTSDSVTVKANSGGTGTLTLKTVQGLTTQCSVTVSNDVESLSMFALTVARGSKKQLVCQKTPSAAASAITFTSADTSIAAVDENGTVTGVGIGETIVTATASNGVSTYCRVTVDAPAEAVSFACPSVTVNKGDTYILNYIPTPSDTTSTFSYSLSTSSYISISNGVVTAKAKGMTVVTLTSSSGVKAYCTVTVVDTPVPVQTVSLDIEEKTLTEGEAFKLTASVEPSGATDKTLTWTSTDPSVAYVSNTGTVTALSAGKTVITAEASNGVSAYCVLTVSGTPSENISRLFIPELISTGEEYVRVPVEIANNPGVNYICLTLDYDAEKLEYDSIENGNIFPSVLCSEQKADSLRLYFTSLADVTDNGILAFVKFRVKDNTSDSALRLCYFPGDVRNYNNAPVALTLFDGAVKKYASAPHTHSDADHSVISRENVVPATCGAEGSYDEVVYCSECGAELSRTKKTIEKLTTHSYDDGRITKDAGCTTDGEKTFTCVCGDTYTEIIPALGHDIVTDAAVPATCTEAGLTEGEHCARCDYEKAQTAVPALGHDIVTDAAVSATCTEAGLTEGEHCVRCDYKKAQTAVPALGHDIVTDAAVPATCTKSGKTEGSHCRVCGEVITAQITVSKLGHSYESTVTVRATTSKSGKLQDVCARCGYTKSSYTSIPMIKSATLSYTTATYNGKTKSPTVTVKDTNGKKLVKDTDYTVSYSNNKSIGKATAKITFKGNYSGTKSLTYKIVPGKVTGLKATQTTTTVKLTWTAVSGAKTYRIYKYSSTTKKYTQVGSTTGTSYTIKNLKAGTIYTRYVKASKTVGDVKYLSTSYAKIRTATKPSTPRTPTLTAGTKKITAKWTKPAGATGIELYMKKGSSGTYKRLYYGQKLTYTKSSLTKGSTYYFKVRAYKTVDDVKIYSAYSSAKSTKAK